jgi:hypothetical protein
MQQANTARYSIVVKNKPGELAKLTKLLSDAGMNVSGLMIANMGDKASIQFMMPRACARRRHLRGTGLKAERPG